MSDFSYKIIRNRRFSSNATISITEKNGVVVRVPFWMPNAFVNNFIEEKTDWIKKHLERLNSKKISQKYTDGEKHLFFGKEYPLSIKTSDSPGRCRIELLEDKLQVQIYSGTPENQYATKIKEALLYWYLEKGIEVITDKVNFYSEKMGVTYKKINLKNVTSIWGSCSPTNCLSFNRKLVMAPHEVVDYVVIHEVAHMVHRNHSSRFWSLVSQFDHQYKSHRRWLKLNHHLLSI